MFVLGVDIGYSNLKLAFGETSAKSPKIRVFPAGAAPADNVSQLVVGGVERAGGFEVQIGGEPYVAAIEQSSIEGWERVLSSDYPFSDDYLALYYAALLATERNEIDMVVTGLPVDQAMDDDTRARLQERLTGTHSVAPGVEVEVKKVKVIPQPLGAYIDFIQSVDNPEIVKRSRVLVIDPGFFSVDYCAIDKGAFDRSTAGSSQEAMSAMLEEAEKQMMRDFGRPIDLASLEEAMRGDGKVAVFGDLKDIRSYIAWVKSSVAESVMRDIRQRQRRSKVQGADFILLPGGGGEYYEDAARTIMEGSKVVTPKDPVVANVRGFYEYARG